MLHLYVDFGLTLVKLGEEARVPLTDFTIEGRNRKKLRHAWRRAGEEGCGFEVVPPEEIPPLMPEIERISNDWLRTKNTREKGFSLGFFDQGYLKRLPLALVRKEGRIVAFANLWPGGEQRGALDRPHAPRGRRAAGGHGLPVHRADALRHASRGTAGSTSAWLRFAGLEKRSIAPMWSRLGSMVYRHGEHFYNFQGLRAYKDKYDPVWEPRYLACPGGLAFPLVLADIAALIGRGFRGVVAK